MDNRSAGAAMKLSIIVATRNRAHAVGPCLDSIVAALVKAFPLDAELVVVDNGSTDDTARVIADCARASPVPVQALSEPRAGKGRALNRALRAAKGELLAFTDDDCRLHGDYVNDLLRHASGDTDLVLRSGRIELGDPTDLPFTIDTRPTRVSWNIADDPARRRNVMRHITGCNMTMRRALVELLGPFDEDFGPGSRIGSGEDSEYAFRAYLAGVTLEHVPDMTVFHHHGRKTAASVHALFRRYMIGSGALNMKFGREYPVLWWQTYWDLKDVVNDILMGRNTLLPEIGFSHRDKVACVSRGALRYLFMRKHHGVWTPGEEERRHAPGEAADARVP
jgi:glycosyltransferase involved in cell wall biosynthesis